MSPQICYYLIIFKGLSDFFFSPFSGLVWPSALILILAAGIMLMIGQGKNISLINRSHELLSFTFRGLAVSFLIWFSVNVFLFSIGTATWTGFPIELEKGWFEMNCPLVSE